MKKLSNILKEGPIQPFNNFHRMLIDEPIKRAKDRGLELEPHYEFEKPEHRSAIKSYTEDGYKNLNHQLWLDHNSPGYHKGYHHTNDPDNNDPNDENGHIGIFKKRMDEVTHLHKTPKQLDVYSAIKSHFNPVEGKVYHHPGFMSTSLSKFTTHNFEHNVGIYNDKKEKYDEHTNILHIRVPKGHPGAYVDHHSMNPGETEFILPRNTKLKHIHTHTYKKPPDKNGSEHYYHVHHMEAMPE